MSDNQKLPYIQLYEQTVPQFAIGTAIYSTFPDLNRIHAHRHDYQTILWAKSGTAQHLVDGVEIQLIPHTLCLIAKGQVHQFIAVDADFEMVYIRFNDVFLPEATFGQRWSYRATLFNTPSHHNQTLAISYDEVAEIDTVLELMQSEYNRTDFIRQSDGLGLLLQFLLLRIEYFQQKSATNLSKNNVTNYKIYQDFITLLEKKFNFEHSVKYYADALNLSSAKLTDITKAILGKSTKQVILDRVMLEAKRLLQFTDDSVKEIAFKSGFSSPFHFSRAFKRHVHSSPDEYRTLFEENDMG